MIGHHTCVTRGTLCTQPEPASNCCTLAQMRFPPSTRPQPCCAVPCCALQAARLRDAEPALQKAAERAAAAASVTDKVGLNAATEERKAKLRQQEVRCCDDDCVMKLFPV